MSRTTFGGSIATAAYALALAAYVATNLDAVISLKPNELGDFLAGTFGPLAFFWLICGYLQQGVELKQNTEALRLQVEELRNSVEHQRELADVAREQLKSDAEELAHRRERARRDALPVFDAVIAWNFDGIMNATFVRMTITNTGNFVRDVSIHVPMVMENFEPAIVRHWEIGAEHLFAWDVPADRNPVPFEMTLGFVDQLGNHGAATMQVTYEAIQTDRYPHFIASVVVLNQA